MNAKKKDINRNQKKKKNNLQLRSNARLLKSKSENQDRIISVKS